MNGLRTYTLVLTLITAADGLRGMYWIQKCYFCFVPRMMVMYDFVYVHPTRSYTIFPTRARLTNLYTSHTARLLRHCTITWQPMAVTFSLAQKHNMISRSTNRSHAFWMNRLVFARKLWDAHMAFKSSDVWIYDYFECAMDAQHSCCGRRNWTYCWSLSWVLMCIIPLSIPYEMNIHQFACRWSTVLVCSMFRQTRRDNRLLGVGWIETTEGIGA